MGRKIPRLPIPVARTIQQMGADIRSARIRRRLRAAVVAERAQISAPTLSRVERGDPAVSLGIYATVLWVLGLLEPLSEVAAPVGDLIGMALEEERLPKRVRQSKRRAAGLATPDLSTDAPPLHRSATPEH